ncbi:ElyC/SanA/YdcF family protein [Lactobacillus sp. ESL0677]|uniref:YdcF family protein n=1 Tax=Lactobacillus sp. ESL0677 TaxID=2983208 RepID=UPI0023F64275|nr:ElyC/SanA/YdcF family protein [Lactobacillus sp. ESL0677]WEV36944.1 YdcF family protein [Lactobacillus sp. ESL0677]
MNKEDQIAKLLARAKNYYLYGNLTEKNEKTFFKGVSINGDQDALEAIFKELIQFDPTNFDYQQDLAATLITDNQIEQAVELLQNILQKAPNNYDALMSYYVYSGIVKDDFSASLLKRLIALDSKRTAMFMQDFANLEKIRQTKIATEINSYEDGHLFILLGYDLRKDGSIPPILHQRLSLALQLLIKNPRSSVIVTGGIPENGHTEAYLMKKWLVNHGVAPERIFTESKSINTIENAEFSLRCAHQIAFSKKITLISSVSHLRRVQILFMIASKKINGAEQIMDIVGTPDVPELINHSSREEQIAMYRDVLRIDDIWLYPNLVR